MQVEITQLDIYPVKSCAGISLQQSQISSRGLQWDREWVVVTHTGKQLTQRVLPDMVLIQPEITTANLVLYAPSMPPLLVDLHTTPSDPVAVRIWDDFTFGSDEGDEVAAWLSQFLGLSCRLLRVHPLARRGLRTAWVSQWLYSAEMTAEDTILAQTRFGFADSFPFLICNEASLIELNKVIQQQGAEPVQMSRFRPNIVIRGLEAYDEDDLSHLVGNGLHFAKLKNCTRCPLPNVNPENGVVGTQPALALRETRRTHEGTLFGVNAALYKDSNSNTIALGQTLDVALTF